MGTWTPGPGPTSGSDVFTGDATAETASGGDGNDTLNGAGGNDTLNGDLGNDQLNGGEGDDTLDGGANDDVLRGGAGNDTLFSGSGNTLDEMYGDEGDDVITVGGGATGFLYGGAGSDVLTGWDFKDRLEGGDGADVLNGGGDRDDLLGGDDNDVLNGGEGNDILSGGNGDDMLNPGTGEGSLTGGLGADTFKFDERSNGVVTIVDFETGAGASDKLDLSFFKIANLDMLLPHMQEDAEGTRIVMLFAGAAQQIFLAGVTIADLTSSRFVFSTATEDLLVDGTFAADTLFGGAGNDIIIFRGGDDLLDGGPGNDRFELNPAAGRATVLNFENGDYLDLHGLGVSDLESLIPYISDTPDGVLIELLWNSQVQSILVAGVSFAELIEGGLKFSTIDFPRTHGGTPGDDIVFGSVSDDTIFSASGDDEINGAAGSDRLYADSGNDLLRGGAGDDRLEGGSGTNILAGGAGFDFAAYSLSPTGVWVDLAAGAYSAAGVWDSFDSIEGLEGSLRNDTLFGDGGVNNLEGGAGDDTLVGRAGNDKLHGGQGNDWLVGGAGADLLEGDLGIDTYSAGTDIAGVVVHLGNGWAQDGWGTFDTLFDIDNIVGSAFNDTLVGSALANTIVGGDGDDWIVGEGGNDLLEGGAGVNVLRGGDGIDLASYASQTGDLWINMSAGVYSRTGVWDVFDALEGVLGGSGSDSIFGNASDNVLLGGAGNDALVGNAGSDRLEGGDGADWLVGGDGADRLIGGAGVDALTGGAGADTFDLGANAGWDVGFDFNTSEDRFSLGGRSWLGFVTLDADGDGQTDDTLLGYAGGNFVALNVNGLTLAQWNALVDAPAGAEGGEMMVAEKGFEPLAADAGLFDQSWPVSQAQGGDNLRELAPELSVLLQDEPQGWGLFG